MFNQEPNKKLYNITSDMSSEGKYNSLNLIKINLVIPIAQTSYRGIVCVRGIFREYFMPPE